MRGWRRAIRRALGAGRTPLPTDALWRAQREALGSAALLVRMFYLCLFFILIQNYGSWAGWMRTPRLEPLWPVAWFHSTGIHAGVGIVLTLSLAGALLAAAWPGVRWMRVLAAIGILEFGAFFNSFGVIGYGWYLWIWVSAIFIVLPDGTIEASESSLARRQRFLRVFWFAQAAALCFYSFSGRMKLAGIVAQLSHGQLSALSPDGLARQIAYRLQEGSVAESSMLGATILRHPALGWPLYLLAIYLEVFSVIVAFRPAAQRLWGLMLIAMHIGIYLMLAIMFSWQMLALGLLLVCSPFAPAGMRLGESVAALPIVADVRRWLAVLRRRTATPKRKPATSEGLFIEDDLTVAAGDSTIRMDG